MQNPTSLSPALKPRPGGRAHAEGVHSAFDAVLPFDGNRLTISDSAGSCSIHVFPALVLIATKPGRLWLRTRLYTWGCWRHVVDLAKQPTAWHQPHKSLPYCARGKLIMTDYEQFCYKTIFHQREGEKQWQWLKQRLRLTCGAFITQLSCQDTNNNRVITRIDQMQQQPQIKCKLQNTRGFPIVFVIVPSLKAAMLQSHCVACVSAVSRGPGWVSLAGWVAGAVSWRLAELVQVINQRVALPSRSFLQNSNTPAIKRTLGSQNAVHCEQKHVTLPAASHMGKWQQH